MTQVEEAYIREQLMKLADSIEVARKDLDRIVDVESGGERFAKDQRLWLESTLGGIRRQAGKIRLVVHW